jgi:ParB family transcriptional regulator, chromosome partitioning protein
MESTITRKPLEWFDTDSQARQDLGPESELRNLGESVGQRQLSPVGAWEKGERGLLIYGHRRLAGAKLVRLPDIEVKIFKGALTEVDLRIIRLTENFFRTDLTQWERFQEADGIRTLLPKLMMKDLAMVLKIDPPHLCRILSPGKCIPAFQEALKAERVGISDCYAASKVSEREQHELLRMKLEEGATRDQLERSVRKARPKGADPVSSSNVTIPLPSGIKVVVRGRRMTLAEVLECLNECVDAAKKGIKEKLTVKSWAAVLRDKSKDVAHV